MADLTSLTARFELQESRMDVQENKLLKLEKLNRDKEEENQQLINDS